MDDAYMIVNLKAENRFSLVNFNTGEVIKGVRRGNGPGEIISTICYQVKDNLFLTYDAERRKIYQVVISPDTTLALEEVEEIHFDKRLSRVDYQVSHVIANGLLEDAWLVTMKSDGEIISGVNYPSFKETNDLPPTALSLIFLNTRVARKPDNKKVVAATQNFGVISFFHYIDGSILEEYRQIKYYGPQFFLTERGTVAWSRDGLTVFCGLDCDDTHVYALYSGRTFTKHGLESFYCEHLLVYDWDGNPVKHYTLDIPLFSMQFDKERKTIYGIAYHPEGVFVEYQL